MTSKVAAGFAAFVLACSVAASAQTLGDLAKQEEARRKTVQSPGKVYTNDSLHPDPGPSTPPSSATSSATTAGDKSASTDKSATDKAAADKSADQAAGKAASKDDPNDEKTWRKKIADARTQLERSQSFAEALQTRINSLTADFASHDDPVQRSQIGADRDKALTQLTQLKKEIDANTKAIADIQEDARKAGVPAGWVR